MRTIIAGGRDFSNYLQLVNDSRKHITEKTEILSGMAQGADTFAIHLAEDLDLPLHEYPADWDVHGRAAGPIRNEIMAQNADMLIAFWDGESRGTKNMIDKALTYGLQVHVYKY